MSHAAASAASAAAPGLASAAPPRAPGTEVTATDAKALSSCPVCSEPLEDPRILPCLHAYCAQCLALRESGPSSDRRVDCLLCGGVFPIPATEGFLADPAGANLAALHKALNLGKGAASGGAGSAPAVTCGADAEHVGVPAVAFCSQCAEPICAECEGDHQRKKGLRSHKVVPLESLALKAYDGVPGLEAAADAAPLLLKARAFAVAPACDVPSHRGEGGTPLPRDMLCKICNVAVCMKCAMTAHNGPNHEISTMQDALISQHKDLADAFAALEKVNAGIKSLVATIDERAGEVASNAGASRGVLSAAFARLRAVLDSRETALLDSLATAERAKRKEADIERDAVQLLVGHVAHTRAYAATLLAACSDGQVVAILPAVVQRAKALGADLAAHAAHPPVDPTLSVTVDEDVTRLCEEIGKLGKLHSTAMLASDVTLLTSTLSLPSVGAIGLIKAKLANSATTARGLELITKGALSLEVPKAYASMVRVVEGPPTVTGSEATWKITLAEAVPDALEALMDLPITLRGEGIVGSPARVITRLPELRWDPSTIHPASDSGVRVEDSGTTAVLDLRSNSSTYNGCFGTVPMVSGVYEWTFEIGGCGNNANLYLGVGSKPFPTTLFTGTGPWNVHW